MRLHEELIHLLMVQDDRIRKSGFAAEMRRISETFADDSERLPTPDAFLVDEEQNAVWVFEVEVSNPISIHNLNRYWSLFWAIDADYWQLHIVVVDRYGIGRIVRLLKATVDDRERPDVLPVDGPPLDVRSENSVPRWLGEVYALRVERMEDESDKQFDLARGMDLWPLGL